MLCMLQWFHPCEGTDNRGRVFLSLLDDIKGKSILSSIAIFISARHSGANMIKHFLLAQELFFLLNFFSLFLNVSNFSLPSRGEK
jgi:hypothetical protein